MQLIQGVAARFDDKLGLMGEQVEKFDNSFFTNFLKKTIMHSNLKFLNSSSALDIESIVLVKQSFLKSAE